MIKIKEKIDTLKKDITQTNFWFGFFITFLILLFTDRALTIWALNNWFVEKNPNLVDIEIILVSSLVIISFINFWKFESLKRLIFILYLLLYTSIILILFSKIIYNV